MTTVQNQVAQPGALAPLEQRRSLRTSIPGPESNVRHARRQSAVADGFGLSLPVFVDRMDGAIILDVDGNQLIDLASGIAVTSVGASAPAVVRRVTEQAARFSHTCFMVTEYEGFVEVAEALNELTPGDHEKKTALFSTGSEAVENAVKIARAATGRPAVIVFDHAYHGRTLLTMTMTAKNMPYKEGFGPFASDVYRVPMAHPYRWIGKDCAAEALEQFIGLVTTQIGASNVAAIVVEPIQGEGGFIVPAPGFLPGVAKFAKENGIVFVADEVQTGFARTGDMFACEREGLIPDLICTAKALGGGMPISAVTGRRELMDAVHVGGLGGTYAGNPLACAATLGVLETIASENLIERARAIEALALPKLQAMAGKSGIIGDVRGRGAMLAMEFVHPGTTDPAPEFAKKVAAYCADHGVIALVCGTYGNVIRLLPPLVISDELLTDALDVIEAGVLGALS